MFGFDASLIIPGRTEGPTPNETLRTLSDLANARAQRQGHEATLAGLLRQRQREDALAAIYAANADAPGVLPRELLRGGFGEQAFGAQDQASQMASAQANREKLQRDAEIAQQRQAFEEAYKRYEAEQRGAQMQETGRHNRSTEALAPWQVVTDSGTGAVRRVNRLTGKMEEVVAGDSSRLRKPKGTVEGESGPDKLLKLDGYDLSPDFSVKPQVAENLREAQASTTTLLQSIEELKGLYRKYGNEVLPGPARARMEALARHIQLEAKGPAMFGLGVIAGPDMMLLDSVAPVPTGKQATLNDFFTGSRDLSETMGRLEVLGERVGSKFDEAARARGYRKQAPAELTPAEAAELSARRKRAGR